MVPGPLLVFSPHLDDAVLSLGCALAARPGSVVVTVLAGVPADGSALTEWDAKCGFRRSADAMRVRWLEDARAMQALGATPVHLSHLNGQYGSVDSAALIAQIADLAEAHSELAALGLIGMGHPDHTLVAEAFVAAMEWIGRDQFWLAADLPYSELGGGSEGRVRRLQARGFMVERDEGGPFDPEVKRAARDCYRSQLVGLGEVPLDAPEVFWRVALSRG